MRCALLLASTVVISVPATATAAPAAESSRIAVLPLRVEGEMSEVARVRIEEALVDGLGRSGAQVLPPAETAKVQVGDCSSRECLGPAFEQLDADYVAWAEIEAEGRDYSVSLRIHAASGSELSRAASCEICGFDEVASTVRGEANAISEKLGDLDAPGTLVIQSEPEGAELLVDGVAIGHAPMSYDLPSGDHVLTLRKKGYATREQKVSVVPGVSERLLLNLNPVETLSETRRTGRIVAWSLIGVGAAGVAAGASLLALHHRPVGSRCDDPANIDVNNLCRWRYNVMVPGIASAGTGAAALLTGIGILAYQDTRRGKGDKDSASRTRTQVSVTPWSASVQTRF